MLLVVEEFALIVGKRVLEDVPPEASEGAVSEPAHEDRPIVGVGRDHTDTFAALGRLVVFRNLAQIDIAAFTVMILDCNHRSDALKFRRAGPKVKRRKGFQEIYCFWKVNCSYFKEIG